MFTYPKLVTPEKYQIKHFEKIDFILQTEKSYTDLSKPGTGKTFPPGFLAQKYGLSLFIVVPLSVIDRWIDFAKEYGIPIECVISYDSLRSFKNKQPKHGYLNRIDSVTAAGSETVEFKETDKLKQLIEKGCVFVFDECNRLKNRSSQFRASATIAGAVYESKSKSRCAFLSGSMFDKPEHARQFLELSNILRSRFMFRTNNLGVLDYMNYGLGEVIQKAMSLDQNKTNRILEKHEISSASSKKFEAIAEKLCYELLSGVILEHLGSIMVRSSTHNLKNGSFVKSLSGKYNADILNMVANYLFGEDKKNGYFKVSPETEKLVSEKVALYAKAISYNPSNDEIDVKKLGQASKYLGQLETSKLEIFERKTIEILKKDPKAKVVIFLNYIETIVELDKKLKKWGSISFYGATKKRGYWINKFMTDPTCRVFIANTMVGGFGFELDDQIGDSMRYMLVSPSYRVIDMFQAMLRIYRKNTKSSVWIRVVYANIKLGKHTLKESRILNAITKKSGVLASIPGGELKNYPGNFEDEYED